MPPPYNKKTKAKLNSFITAKYDAPEDWPCYPVYLRGHADTSTEAQKKISKILKNKKSYAYSTENETHAKEISAHNTKYFQEKSKKKHEDVIEKILYEKETENIHGSDFANDNSSELANNEDQFISDKRIEIKEKEIRKRESNKKKKYCKEHRHTQHAQLDTNIVFLHVIFQSTESKDTNNKNNHFSKDILLLHTAIKSLEVEVKLQSEQIMLMRNAMEQTLQPKIGSMTVQKFTEKHNVTLKLQNIQEFNNFEQRLIEDEQFRADFKASLKHLTERNIQDNCDDIKKIFESTFSHATHSSASI